VEKLGVAPPGLSVKWRKPRLPKLPVKPPNPDALKSIWRTPQIVELPKDERRPAPKAPRPTLPKFGGIRLLEETACAEPRRMLLRGFWNDDPVEFGEAVGALRRYLRRISEE
jgi:hypothetical protein